MDKNKSPMESNFEKSETLQKKNGSKSQQMPESHISADLKHSQNPSDVENKSQLNETSDNEQNSVSNGTSNIEKQSAPFKAVENEDANGTVNLESKSDFKAKLKFRTKSVTIINNGTESDFIITGHLETSSEEKLVLDTNAVEKFSAAAAPIDKQSSSKNSDWNIVKQKISLYKEKATYKEKEFTNYFYYNSNENLPKARHWFKTLENLKIAAQVKTYQYVDKTYSNILLTNL